MIPTCSALTSPAACAAANTGRTGPNGCPNGLTRGPTASAARTRRDASPRDNRNTEVNTRRIDP